MQMLRWSIDKYWKYCGNKESYKSPMNRKVLPPTDSPNALVTHEWREKDGWNWNIERPPEKRIRYFSSFWRVAHWLSHLCVKCTRLKLVKQWLNSSTKSRYGSTQYWIGIHSKQFITCLNGETGRRSRTRASRKRLTSNSTSQIANVASIIHLGQIQYRGTQILSLFLTAF